MDSILDSTKQILGLELTYTAFDVDVITHLNAAFSVLDQLGVGPAGGFYISDGTANWDDIGLPNNQLNLVKSYVYLKVRILFDPPGTGFLMNNMQEQIKQFEWRLNQMREAELGGLDPEETNYVTYVTGPAPPSDPDVGTIYIPTS